MNYTIYPNDPERYATNLRLAKDGRQLIWETAQGQGTLLVQLPFGEKVEDHLEALCETLSKTALQDKAYTMVLPNVWVRFVTATEKAKNGGCPIHHEASSYTVLAYDQTPLEYKVYRPTTGGMIPNTVHIPLGVCVRVQQETVRKGFGPFAREVETGFYMMSFPSDLAEKDVTGSLGYCIGDFEVPITKEMTQNGTVYIETAVRPAVVSKNSGIQLV